jgi:hypothetical protein
MCKSRDYETRGSTNQIAVSHAEKIENLDFKKFF